MQVVVIPSNIKVWLRCLFTIGLCVTALGSLQSQELRWDFIRVAIVNLEKSTVGSGFQRRDLMDRVQLLPISWPWETEHVFLIQSFRTPCRKQPQAPYKKYPFLSYPSPSPAKLLSLLIAGTCVSAPTNQFPIPPPHHVIFRLSPLAKCSPFFPYLQASTARLLSVLMPQEILLPATTQNTKDANTNRRFSQMAGEFIWDRKRK